MSEELRTRDDDILSLAKAVTTLVRASSLKHDDYQAAFGVARELLNAEWSAQWKSECTTLGAVRDPEIVQ